MAPRKMHIQLGETLHQELREAAAREGVSLAEYVRAAVASRLAYERALRDAASERGGAGGGERRSPP